MAFARFPGEPAPTCSMSSLKGVVCGAKPHLCFVCRVHVCVCVPCPLIDTELADMGPSAIRGHF